MGFAINIVSQNATNLLSTGHNLVHGFILLCFVCVHYDVIAWKHVPVMRETLRPTVTGRLTSQMVKNAESVSMAWCHYAEPLNSIMLGHVVWSCIKGVPELIQWKQNATDGAAKLRLGFKEPWTNFRHKRCRKPWCVVSICENILQKLILGDLLL